MGFVHAVFHKTVFFEIHIGEYVLVGVQVYFSCKKGELDRFFDRLRHILVARKENFTGFLTDLDVF